MTKKNILALGDCNTLGVGRLEKNSYPERLAKVLDLEVINCGYTMATTREGLSLLQRNINTNCVLLLIQFGLVDSYPTFKYAPYIRYYPDNPLRKQLRSIVKKIKKLSRKHGLNKRFGEKNVTHEKAYSANILQMLQVAGQTTTLLIDTIPNKQPGRNKHIQHYNELLTILASQYPHCIKINLFEDFMRNINNFYIDETHCNSTGYDFITEKILQKIK